MRPRTVPLKGIISAHRQVFDLLLQVNQQHGLCSVLRVAGGWVRDSLLGIPCHDIDIAIETTDRSPRKITGEVFARAIAAFQAANNMCPHSVSVVRTNPDMSKHIETAQITIFDIPVEFCSLRQDEYDSSSRVPVVRPATPMEDAQRRDFTLNALFYNLHTGLVEDYISGLEDLKTKTLRCPLSPIETFMDDPLRLLRGIRFAGRLNFALDTSIMEAVNERIILALQTKVSRERVGIEWTKMLTGPRPDLCYELMHKLNLQRDIIFQEIYLPAAEKKGKSLGMDLPVKPPIVVPLIGHDEAGAELDWMICTLSRTVSPLTTQPDSPLFQESVEYRLTSICFILGASIYCHVPAPERAERLHSWCVHSLKLPVYVANGSRRMLDAMDFVTEDIVKMCRDTPTEVPLPSTVKDTVFDALLPLQDKSVPLNPLSVVFAVAIVKYIGIQNFAEDLGKIWHNLTKETGLLAAFSTTMPIRGDEIKSLLHVAPKDIGWNILLMRRYMMQHPQASRAEVEQYLKMQQTK